MQYLSLINKSFKIQLISIALIYAIGSYKYVICKCMLYRCSYAICKCRFQFIVCKTMPPMIGGIT